MKKTYIGSISVYAEERPSDKAVVLRDEFGMYRTVLSYDEAKAIGDNVGWHERTLRTIFFARFRADRKEE